jgi:branched-chain amino acid transport system permease protein
VSASANRPPALTAVAARLVAMLPSFLVPLLAVAGLVALLPVAFGSPYALSTMTLIGVYTIVTIGLCLLTGYAGQASLGQAGFLALGAYGSGVLTTRFAVAPWLALPLAAVGAGVVAWLVGVPVLRLRGHYLAMGTLALGVVISIAIRESKSLTGGSSGLAGIPHLSIAGVVIRGDRAYYYVVWAVALLALLVALNVVNSRVGRALRAIRASEAAAASVGVDVDGTKLAVFVLAAMYASVAGSLYAHYMTFISPAAFDLDVSVRLVLMAAVGGLASIWGAPFGTATVVLLALVLRETVAAISPASGGEYQSIVYGLLLVAIMIFMPEGVTAYAGRVRASAGGGGPRARRLSRLPLPWRGGRGRV